ncbi:MAG: hypothetical protein LC749_13560, partial [Actinobacteria bacterium]|nr:hypothetical protein [Actinomycetota bacterium]
MAGRGSALAVVAAALILTGCGSTITTAPDATTETSPTTTAPAPTPDGAAGDNETLAGRSHCGVERWAVKTGSDPDVGLIDLKKPPLGATV